MFLNEVWKLFILIAPWQWSCPSVLASFALLMCRLVFSQRYKRTPTWFLELFLLWVPLFSLLCPQDSRHLCLPDVTSQLIEAAMLLSVACSAQWSGKGPQAELQGSYRVYLLCFPFFRGCRPNLSVVQCLITVLYFLCFLVTERGWIWYLSSNMPDTESALLIFVFRDASRTILLNELNHI